MIVLFSFCDIPWWFTWLLPFLLGLGLGYLWWAKYKSIVKDLNIKINELDIKIAGLEADLAKCRKARLEAEGNVSLLKGRLREIEIAGAGIVKNVKTENAKEAVSPTSKMANGDATFQKMEVSEPMNDNDNWFGTIGTDKLQIIEGIGPKMEEVLKENGINDFSILAKTSKETLRDILNKYGDKYRIIDPNTWPQQAALADSRSWNELITLQKSLDTGRSDTTTVEASDSKLEKWLIKAGVLRRWTQDDLKAVEGIGPKIEQLLHAENIKTWRALSETPISRIQEILTNAGPRFALADPGTWSEQAEMAADGRWDELKKYQDFLNVGKSKK
jgi:predicted flap endonuclease-1-like 5' DNA nuclease